MALVAVLALVAVAACGGGGKCERPPCEIPPHACDADDDCFQTEFCNFERNTCGTASMDRGICAARPARDDCPFEGVALVCGCDGQFHENRCAAARAGTDVDNGGGCPLPPGAFACGGEACLRDQQFCVELVRGADDSQFGCESLPEECLRNPTCACVPSFGCSECTEQNGELRMKCPIDTPTPDQ